MQAYSHCRMHVRVNILRRIQTQTHARTHTHACMRGADYAYLRGEICRQSLRATVQLRWQRPVRGPVAAFGHDMQEIGDLARLELPNLLQGRLLQRLQSVCLHPRPVAVLRHHHVPERRSDIDVVEVGSPRCHERAQRCGGLAREDPPVEVQVRVLALPARTAAVASPAHRAAIRAHVPRARSRVSAVRGRRRCGRRCGRRCSVPPAPRRRHRRRRQHLGPLDAGFAANRLTEIPIGPCERRGRA